MEMCGDLVLYLDAPSLLFHIQSY